MDASQPVTNPGPVPARAARRGRLLRRGAAAALLLAAVAQAVPVDRDNPPVLAELPAPPDVHALLQRACYDCHSHETHWPWYAHVAPVSWLVAHDVHDGRAELNFSMWAAGVDERARHLRKAAEEVREGEMPPASYVVLHPEARLAAAESERLVEWLSQQGGPAGSGDDLAGG